jgi:hypothetical protein
LKIAPGEHTIAIAFTPEDPASGGQPLTFEGRVFFAPSRVVLVTYENGRLTAR